LGKQVFGFSQNCAHTSKWLNKMSGLQNENPVVYSVGQTYKVNEILDGIDEDEREIVNSLEVFEMVRRINDPEHPLTLEQLHVLSAENIEVDDPKNRVVVKITPTIPHCSMATLIGLCVRVQLLRSLPRRFKVTILINPGTHQQEESINKQLNDKERVAAALENNHLLDVVNKCILPKD
jgi:metal-sulfur cluster biosynthetic enzyme